MKIYSYYESISGFSEDPVIQRWRETWTAHGWEPTLLGRADAEKHILFDSYEKVISTLPTVNPRQYEAACFLRWLAMLSVGGGFMCDYDVMNNGLKPDQVSSFIKSPTMIFLESNGVPSAVLGNDIAFTRAVILFALYEPDSKDVCNGRPHISDQDISCRKFSDAGFLLHKMCRQYSDIGWEKSPLIHFSNPSTQGKKKERLEEWITQKKA